MKVLQILSYYYPKIGGIETVAQDISNALGNHDSSIEQKIICFNEDAKSEDISCKRNTDQVDNIEFAEITRCKCVTKVASQSISFTFKKKLKNLLKSFKPDLVIFHYPNPFEATYIRRYLDKKTKFIIFFHLDITKQKVLGKLFAGQSKWLLKRADKIVSTSPIYAKESKLLTQFKDKVIVVPLCIGKARLIDNEKVDAKIKALKAENKDKILCFFYGRHVPYKGLEYLIAANEYVDRDKVNIAIAGQGPLTAQLKEAASKYDNIQFVGRLSDEDINAYLKACDLFLFPSITRNEAFGIALAEGLYFGKPALTFNVPGSGVNWVSVDKETGLEAPNRDVKAYANNLMTLVNDVKLRNKMSQNCINRAKEFFTIEAFSNNIINVITNVMEGK